VQFLVGHNRVRYELVVNWVQKDKVGGYLSIPKDKSLCRQIRADFGLRSERSNSRNPKSAIRAFLHTDPAVLSLIP